MKRRTILKGMATAVAGATAAPAAHIASAIRGETKPAFPEPRQWWALYHGSTSTAPRVEPGDQLLMQDCARYEGHGVYLWDTGDGEMISRVVDVPNSSTVLARNESIEGRHARQMDVAEFDKTIIARVKAVYHPVHAEPLVEYKRGTSS